MIDNNNNNKSTQKANMSTPVAIIIAGFFVAVAIVFSNSGFLQNNGESKNDPKKPEYKYQAYVDLGNEIDLDEKKFVACMDKFDTAEVKNDLADAQKYGANGTPSFFIGKSTDNGVIKGILIAGAQPISVFQGIIDGFIEDDSTKVLNSLLPNPDGTLTTDLESVLVEVSLDDDSVLGDSNAPVTIVEFSDYECPFCKRAFEQTYPILKSDYINTGKAKFVFRDLPLPFHDPVATEEAVAANCAKEQGGDKAYFEYHDKIFENTKSNGEGLN